VIAIVVALALVAAACSGSDAEPEAEAEAQPQTEATPDDGVTITVDTSIQLEFSTLPGLDGGEERPVAAVTGEDGEIAMFVENEIWIGTDDRAELDSLVERYGATIISEVDTSGLDVDGLPSQYLLRLDAIPETADRLSADLADLGVEGSGEFAVSSADGLALLGAAANEAAAGGTVGINWVGRPDDFSDRISEEAPTGESLEGVQYDPNAFLWPSHSEGDDSELDIGVAEAWRALEAAGRLNPNTIPLAVLDMGFQPDADWADGWAAVTVAGLPLLPTGTENLLDCGGGQCPWHGTNVVSAAMAVADNSYGSAGPGGPVAHPIAMFTTYDMFMSVSALLEVRAMGARIANMSYQIPVPWYLAWSLLPFEAATAGLSKTGMLIFAAAGNDGKDVDKEGCTLRVCFERTWYAPCENAGVICVGGTRGINADRAQGSNYGAEQVDIYAPFTLWLGPDPANPDNEARALSGTSFSSPFVAGVAALVWAADPGLSASQVEEILMETARRSGDEDVSRVVSAINGVRRALGNINPEITLVSPTDGREIQLNETVQLRVNVSDFEDGGAVCCPVEWTGVSLGNIGSGTDVERVFDETGVFTITATATDRDGASSSVTTTVEVINSAPVMTIANPLPDAEVFAGVPFAVSGSSFDVNEFGPLECGALEWTTNIAAEVSATGCDATITLVDLGPRALTLTGADPQGRTGSATVDIVVVTPPANRPPVVQILEPMLLAGLADQLTDLVGAAVDPEGDQNLTAVWTLTWPYDRVSRTGDNVAPIAAGLTSAFEPRDYIDGVGQNVDLSMSVLLELRVTDSGGNVGVAAVELSLIQIN
jgi:serine protease